ncbi:FAD dependent oxidoreductase, putative [marine gamma proteobacterium HTCC2148]|jgi:sarcosine oxidase subunit beta|uniref:Sarcosine oxidase subunit beta n=1 Tax=Candidatus Seongchinamella marina TaxID=2518990 RepID=A0ABT3STA0_9GAMM|nr:sarcosine oxidase subunit beta family protein [Candidatus Seongchinamella marina]EEB79927.1 FAD dependent oxidoreductase, putative [marine gamma proteobacterium HTCC2148]MBT6126914.1 sarcosine oxidase subunit beta family protein [Halieaceae bacterium]MCX2973206.1 sarcosine oxidase subunit beta family protein [Candidatus Seongchinamella marina]MDG1389194.1 sarcosine oxidase subunit beta family protein [Halioglobus sp.]
MEKYSLFKLFNHARTYNENWQRAWRSPVPKSDYDVVIVGGGGHGLATAYYLAKVHGITNVAVVEKGYLGGGNTARNTTIIRSNYLWDEAAQLYELSLKLWEGLSQELNFNVMFSQRGVLNLGHTLQDMRDIQRRVNANRLNGIDGVVLSTAEVQARVPLMNCSPNARYPILGASWQPRGGTARHDAVAWGYARGADALGVDLIQQTEVTGIRRHNGAVVGVETANGFIGARKVACVTAGNSGVMAAMAGLRLPIESRPLQALVSEPLKPCLDTVVMSNAVHGYISQSDKGDLVVGAGVDSYNGYGQRGSFNVIEHTLQAICELFPSFSRVRMNRHWGGIVDTCPDACPIISKTPVEGLFFNCGWGTGGFKATPGSGYVFADTVANDRPHPLAEAFNIDRFYSGALIDEHGAAGVAH